MKLKRLYIKNYKILQDFEVHFPFDSQKYISLFIGVNGSGKSTLLEAIAQILSDTQLQKPAKFGFELEYSMRHEEIVENTGNHAYIETQYTHVKLSAQEAGEEIKIETDPMVTKATVLPDGVVIYYSGLSEIMRNLVQPHNKILTDERRKNNFLVNRDFFYFEPFHFETILAALLSYEYGDIPEFLLSKAKIATMQSMVIHLKKPEWAKGKIQDFWGAEGEVRSFLNFLDENSMTPKDLDDPENATAKANIVMEAWQDEALIITIMGQRSLYFIREYLMVEKELFEILNLMHIDGMLDFIEFNLKDEQGHSFDTLSEGEQQIVVMKGLMEFLSEKNTLFLFDEPDTYLHPKWQRQFISEIENYVQSFEIENYFLITTHSPQLLSNADGQHSELKIIEEGKIIEKTPKYYGRKIDSILYELMDVEERTEAIQKQIKNLFILIEEENIDEAEKLLSELQELLGEDADLTRAQIQLEYLKDDRDETDT